MTRLSRIARPALLAASLGLSACYVPLNTQNPFAPAASPTPAVPVAIGQAASLSATKGSVELSLGEERLLGDLLKDQAGNQPAPGAILWQSTNPAVASVHPTTGQAKGVAPGVAIFVATLAANPAARTQLEVKVVDKFTVRQITVEPANPTLVIGEKASLRAAVAMADGTISANVVWSSSDDTIATVNPTNGEVTALKEGRVTIEGTYALDTRFKGVANVTVLREKGAQPPAPQPSTIVFGPGGAAPGAGSQPGSQPATDPGQPLVKAGVAGRFVHQVSGITTQIATVDFQDPLTGWACSSDTLLSTSDGGVTWKTATPGALAGQDIRGVHFAGQAGVVLAGNALHNSTDGGATWTKTALPPEAGVVVRMAFQDANVGFLFPAAIGNTALYLRTLDGGVTWSKVSVPGVSSVVDAIRVGNADVVLANDGLYVYDASLGGYDKRQATYASIDQRGQRTSALATDGQAAWFFDTQNATLFTSADHGVNWSSSGPLKQADGKPLPMPGPLRDLVVLRDGKIFLMSHLAVIASADGGKTWAVSEGLSMAGGGILDAHFLDGATGWLVGDQGKIVRFSGR